jgi:DnaJ-class molecular chaperone
VKNKKPNFVSPIPLHCPACNGTGVVWDDYSGWIPCSKCGGSGQT